MSNFNSAEQSNPENSEYLVELTNEESSAIVGGASPIESMRRTFDEAIRRSTRITRIQTQGQSRLRASKQRPS